MIWVLDTASMQLLNGDLGPMCEVVVHGELLIDFFRVTDAWNSSSLQDLTSAICHILVVIRGAAVKEVCFLQ